MKKPVGIFITSITCITITSACAIVDKKSNANNASISECPAWEIAVMPISTIDDKLNVYTPTTDDPKRLANGWEPFGVVDQKLILRRCAKQATQ
jgi:hypothetical protein